MLTVADMLPYGVVFGASAVSPTYAGGTGGIPVAGGLVYSPGMVVVGANGVVFSANGTIVGPNGTVFGTNGTMVGTLGANGVIFGPSGTAIGTLGPNGTMVGTNGTVTGTLGPNGTIVGTNAIGGQRGRSVREREAAPPSIPVATSSAPTAPSWEHWGRTAPSSARTGP